MARQETLERPDFYTIGYERLKIAELFDILRSNGVRALIDVRNSPWSRVPEYTKSSLEKNIKKLSIDESYEISYLSLPEAGNPPEIRHSESESWKDQYLAYILNEEKVLELLASMISNKKVALICYEKDPGECHRSVLARVLREKYGFTYLELSK